LVQKLRGFQSWHVCTRIIFSFYSCPIANHGGYLCTDHVHVSTYLVTTKGITYLPAYVVTTYIPLPILLYMMLTYRCCSILISSENLWFRFEGFETFDRTPDLLPELVLHISRLLVLGSIHPKQINRMQKKFGNTNILLFKIQNVLSQDLYLPSRSLNLFS
jgi:hypothetical protein